MRLFKIKYVLTNNVTMNVGIVANNREESIKYLKNHQKNIRSIEMITIGDEIHAIEESIVDIYINKKDKVKKLKEDIQYLKNCLLESDEIIEKLQSNPVEKPVNVNEIGMLHEKIVQLETEKMELMENSSGESSKKLQDENKKLQEKIEELKKKEQEYSEHILDLSRKVEKSEKKTEIKKVYVCPECEQELSSPRGVKQHYTKMHKDK
jgi:hypothetical protein